MNNNNNASDNNIRILLLFYKNNAGDNNTSLWLPKLIAKLNLGAKSKIKLIYHTWILLDINKY